MTPLLIVSFLCIAIGLGMVFLHNRKSETGDITAPNKPDSFAKEMLAAVTDFYPDVPFRYTPSADVIDTPDDYDGDHQYQFYLGNMRNRSRDMGRKDRAAYIREMIATFTDRSEITAQELKESLYLRARTGSELVLRNILLDSPDKTGGSVAAINRDDIILELVMDLPNGVRVIDLETLEEHDIKMDEAVNIAGNNLLRATPTEGADLWEKVSENIWISKLHDDYDAARVFTFPEHLPLPFKGLATAYAPAHAIMLITDKPDEDTLNRMVEFGNNAAEVHRPLSLALWGQTETGWKRLTSKERRSMIWQAALADDTMAYSEQKNILEQIFEKKEKDIFVASVMAAKEKDGEIFTLAVFIDGHCYMPIVDYIVLHDEAEESFKVPWSRFIDILGPERLKAVPELTPKRLEFKGDLPSEIKHALISTSETL